MLFAVRVPAHPTWVMRAAGDGTMLSISNRNSRGSTDAEGDGLIER